MHLLRRHGRHGHSIRVRCDTGDSRWRRRVIHACRGYGGHDNSGGSEQISLVSIDTCHNEQNEMDGSHHAEQSGHGAKHGQIHAVHVLGVLVAIIIAVTVIGVAAIHHFGAVVDDRLYRDGESDRDKDGEHAGDPETEVQTNVCSWVNPALYILPRANSEGDQLSTIPQDRENGDW